MLEAILPQLPEAERRVADHLLRDPEQVLLSPITRLAAESGVAPSTVVRLCGRLGVSGFQELKIALAVETVGLGRLHPEAGDEPDGAASVIRRTIELTIENLSSTAGLLDPGALDRVGRAIVSARRIEIYAQGPATGAIAHILQTWLLLGGIPSTVHTYVGFQHLSAGLLAQGDLAIAISQSGETEPVVRALGAARQAGATTVCITNTPLSSVTREAEVCLLAASHSAGPASHRPASLASMLAVVEAVNSFALLLRYVGQADREAAARQAQEEEGP